MESLLSKFVTYSIFDTLINPTHYKSIIRLENQEYDDISTGRTQPTGTEGERHVYQTLKLNEMNYESMHVCQDYANKEVDLIINLC